MKKSYLCIALMLAAFSVPFTSCKDYSDDINDLQSQIDKIEVSVGELQKLINEGVRILSIEQTADGVLIITADGKNYTISNGNGSGSADVWTIGNDGYWYKNGVKTDYRAIGETGAQGAPGAQGPEGPMGPQGPQGAQGKTGNYYKPNPETGCFDLYDGETNQLISSTNISYAAGGGALSAVYSGNKITFYGVDGTDKGVEIPIGTPVGSLVFIPSVYDGKLPYATTDEPFYYLRSYLDDAKYNTSTRAFIPQNWNASNEVEFEYRINPNGAYVAPAPNAQVKFINRTMTTRAAGDNTNLLKAVSVEAANDELSVMARIYPDYLAGDNVVTAMLWNGQDPVTSSDYVTVDADEVTTRIYDPAISPAPVYYYDRNKSIAGGESSDFIQSIVPLTAAANLRVQYNQEIDLMNYVALWCPDLTKPLKQVGFEGEEFIFTLPASYVADDTQHTNQQWFAELNGSVLKANSKNLEYGLTPAIGRTPVVRVDAYLPDNDGNKKMVASSYIKLIFTEEPTTPGQTPEELKPLTIPVGERYFNYSQLTANPDQVGQMLWQDVNNKVYGSQALNAENFWNYYRHTFDVTLDVATNNAGATQRLFTDIGQVGTQFTYSADGIFCNVLFNYGNTNTSQIDFKVNNLCKTNETYFNCYKEENGQRIDLGAKFTVTITLTPNDKTVKQPINIVQVFYVLNDFKPYKYNENFIVPGSNPETVQTKGIVTPNGWAMQMDIAQAFRKMNGMDIFQYFADASVDASYANILSNPQIKFDFRTPTSGVAYGPSTFADHIIGLTEALTSENKIAPMKYEVKLVNGEPLVRNFNVEFINPFVAGQEKPITINGNYLGTQTANAAQSVIVNERNSNPVQVILSYAGSGLALSSRATDFFKLQSTQVEVTYDWDTNAGDWESFHNQLPEGSYVDLVKNGPNAGMIEYHASAVLQLDRTLYVVATVTFKDLSVVKVRIPVNFKKSI